MTEKQTPEIASIEHGTQISINQIEKIIPHEILNHLANMTNEDFVIIGGSAAAIIEPQEYFGDIDIMVTDTIANNLPENKKQKTYGFEFESEGLKIDISYLKKIAEKRQQLVIQMKDFLQAKKELNKKETEMVDSLEARMLMLENPNFDNLSLQHNFWAHQTISIKGSKNAKKELQFTFYDPHNMRSVGQTSLRKEIAPDINYFSIDYMLIELLIDNPNSEELGVTETQLKGLVGNYGRLIRQWGERKLYTPLIKGGKVDRFIEVIHELHNGQIEIGLPKDQVTEIIEDSARYSFARLIIADPNMALDQLTGYLGTQLLVESLGLPLVPLINKTNTKKFYNILKNGNKEIDVNKFLAHILKSDATLKHSTDRLVKQAETIEEKWKNVNSTRFKNPTAKKIASEVLS